VTDALGHGSMLSYDHGDVRSVTDPLRRVTTRSLDAVGHPIAFADALGAVTARAYDPLGRPTTITDPLGGRPDSRMTPIATCLP
jgi:YD repeat-containing protein